ncbi:MAG: hypothetical protein VXX55_05915 [Planctomycetota bacterium]|nr:hypothetical protein [Planctomycetota bacterium]
MLSGLNRNEIHDFVRIPEPRSRATQFHFWCETAYDHGNCGEATVRKTTTVASLGQPLPAASANLQELCYDHPLHIVG